MATEPKKDKGPDIIDIKPNPIKYDKKDRMMRGMSMDAEFKKKHGDNWRQIASAISHVHTTHRDATVKHL